MKSLKAIRGAIFVDEDTPEEIKRRTLQLMEKIYTANSMGDEEVVAVVFSVTKGIRSFNPATAFRESGHDLPLMCLQEADFEGAPLMVVRVMILANSEKSVNVYENGALSLKNGGRK
jgi:monofunctional chorismate mutase|uniref:chorismate mutase n=1 Tax=Mesoaciditoga lauensis TaxID=1495039 RepID=A0A7V3RF21_9BACT